MKNQVQTDEIVTLAAPYAVSSGGGALIGFLFGVAGKTLANAEVGAFVTRGVFDLTKVASQAWTVGAKIYWDNAAKNCTTVSAGNTLVGVTTLAVGSGATETVGRVRLGIGHPGHKDRVSPYVLGNYAKAEMDDLAHMLGAVAAEAPLLATGDEVRYMNNIALRMQQD